jgi:hypothetical protein
LFVNAGFLHYRASNCLPENLFVDTDSGIFLART